MFNVKISLLYFLLVVLSVVSILMTVWTKQDEAVDQIGQTMESVPEMFRLHQELREERLREYANLVGGSELQARIKALHGARGDFLEVDRFILDPETGVPGSVPSAHEQRKALAVEKFGATVFQRFANSLTKEMKRYRKWNDSSEKSFRTNVLSRLGKCFDWSKRCVTPFLYVPLVEKVLPSLKAEGRSFDAGPGTPELLLVFDADGVGMAKANDGGAWSNNTDFRGMVQSLRERVKAAGPAGARQSTVEAIRLQEALYLAVLVPVLDSDGRFIGAIMAGESVTGRTVGPEKSLFGYEVTYLSGHRAEETIIATTVHPPSDTEFMVTTAKGTHKMKRHSVVSEKWVGIGFPYFPFRAHQLVESGDRAYGQHYKQLRVVMVSDKSALLGPFEWLETLVIIFGVAILVIGLILIWLLIYTHNRPFEQMDTGIHEVINGNFDYQFAFDYRDELPASMAQSLNLMVAVLQGKSIDDDEVGDSRWDTEGFGASPGSSPDLMNAAIAIARAPKEASAGDVDVAALFQLPAEQYYRDLYAQYRDMKVSLGEDVAEVTYVRFVERLVRSEREFQKDGGSKDIRYVVRDVKGCTTLVPVTR